MYVSDVQTRANVKCINPLVKTIMMPTRSVYKESNLSNHFRKSFNYVDCT